MKTPEQIAAETAEKMVQDGLSVRAKNHMADHWPDSINALTECARDYILAALTEHAAQTQADAWMAGAKVVEKYKAELTALRAVADEMERFIKSIKPEPPYGELEGQWVYATSLVTRYAALRAEEKGAV